MSDAYWLFFVMVIFTVASPGPGVLMTLDNAIARGWRIAMYGVIGLAIGAAGTATLCFSGLGLLVSSSPTLFMFLKYCGVCYLLYLAWKAWRRVSTTLTCQTHMKEISCDFESFHDGRYRLLARAALLQTSNPKSLLFFLSALPQFIAPHPDIVSSVMMMLFPIATYCMTLIVIHGVYAALAAKTARWLNQSHAARLLSRGSALMFLFFAIVMVRMTV